MEDALSLLLLPFAAAVVFVLIHAYFGVHVLRRNVVFADLALAQLSALGATVAFASGYAPTSAAAFGYALLFTAIGAALLTLSRGVARYVSREVGIGGGGGHAAHSRPARRRVTEPTRYRTRGAGA